jgi:hypothetical protein
VTGVQTCALPIYALDNQSFIKQGLSVPAEGLTLTEVKYPWEI